MLFHCFSSICLWNSAVLNFNIFLIYCTNFNTIAGLQLSVNTSQYSVALQYHINFQIVFASTHFIEKAYVPPVPSPATILPTPRNRVNIKVSPEILIKLKSSEWFIAMKFDLCLFRVLQLIVSFIWSWVCVLRHASSPLRWTAHSMLFIMWQCCNAFCNRYKAITTNWSPAPCARHVTNQLGVTTAG